MSLDLVTLFQRAAVSSVINEGTPAIIGRRDGVTTYIDPSGNIQEKKCWVQLGEDGAETVVTCEIVAHVAGAAVRVADRYGVPTVIGLDRKVAETWSANGTNLNSPPHRHDIDSHNPDFIESLRFLPLLAWPSTPLAMTVTVNAGVYWHQGLPVYFSGGTTGSLSGYVPVTVGIRHFVIIAIDRSTNALAVIDGADVGNPILPVNVSIDDVAEIAVEDKYYPLAVVQFYLGQTAVIQSDIRFDLRQFNGSREGIQFAGEGSVGPGPNTVTLYYAGIDFTVIDDYTIAVPAGRYFWPGEIGVICDTLTTLTSQPEVQAGIVGNTDKLLTPTTTTELTAAQKRETFTAATGEDGETAITVGVTTAAVAAAMTGTIYVRGILK